MGRKPPNQILMDKHFLYKFLEIHSIFFIILTFYDQNNETVMPL